MIVVVILMYVFFLADWDFRLPTWWFYLTQKDKRSGQSIKNGMHTYVHTIHSTTLHYSTLQYITLHYYITLHCTTVHYTTFHHTTLPCIPFHSIPFPAGPASKVPRRHPARIVEVS